ncbi:MAG: pyridoxal-phosphate dependent enzyme [Chloroflexi bacterium]|nr:pyridoxal-phosphate dependent enzyme [Chloroflexota bacterium]
MIPLFKNYPRLADRLPYVSLGEFPTPVHKLERLGREIGLNRLYIKCDDLSGKIYGGNKVRKLEFILGQALRDDVKELLILGLIGNRQAVATTVYSHQLGMKCVCMMIPAPVDRQVRRNLLLTHSCGAELHYQPKISLLVLDAIYQLLRHKLQWGSFPRFLSGKGFSILGAIGYVNAALELKEQIIAGEIPEPDFIYVARGGSSTAVGLMLGLRAAKLKTRVISLGAYPQNRTLADKIAGFYGKAAYYLNLLDSSFPRLEYSEDDADIRDGFSRRRDDWFKEECKEAIELMKESEGIELDTIYTGRTLACLIDDARKGRLKNKVILFWNTFNSRDFSDVIASVDYHNMPRGFHRYFGGG